MNKREEVKIHMMSKIFAVVILAAAAFWGLVFGKVYAQASSEQITPTAQAPQSNDGAR
jgi:hypothetical protein